MSSKAPAKRLFTPRQVDRLIPRLERILGRLYVALADLLATRREILRRGMPAEPDALDHGSLPPEHLELARRFVEGLRQATRHVHAIVQLGGRVEDLDLGVVDFPARRGERPVVLCWRYGEKVVAYYHDAGEGYAQRCPLDDERVRKVAVAFN